MREIKFRAWHKGKMTYNHSYNLNIGGHVYYLDTTGEWEQDEAKEVVLMQFTGLRDKNGVEIYEGDIVKDDEGRVGEVEWVQEYCQFMVLFVDNWPPNEPGDWATVIGNIYQNPELLNGKEAGEG